MLLKADEFQAKADKTVRFNLNDIAAEARQIVADAKRHRSEIISQAERKAEEIHEHAKRDGHHAGYEEGLTEGRKAGHDEAFQQAQAEFRQQAAELISMLTNTFTEFDGIKKQLLWHAEQDTVVLALAVAEKVTRQMGLTDRRVAAENVAGALKLVAGGTNVTVRLNAADLDHMKELAGDNDAVLGQYASIRFETDEGIAPGGCCICTEQGEIDAQLDTQLQSIADELLMNGTHGKHGDSQ